MAQLFGWSEKYSLGIREVDLQHRKLIAMICKLDESMRKGEGREVLGRTLRELVDYTEYHFGSEERLMKEHGYPEFEEHKTKHEKMTRRVLDIQKEYQEGRVGITIEVMKFLENWLDKHILGTDMKYAPFLKSAGIQ